ncbi:MAG: hypothetical protein AB1938_00945 [Myxococcota bacterium]
MIKNVIRSGVAVMVLEVFPVFAQGLALPYSGSTSTPGSAFSVSNAYASGDATPYAMRADGLNQSSGLRASSTVGYAVDAVSVSGFASVFSTNTSGTWGIQRR